MQRSMPIITTKVAVIGGFLLLGLLAVAVWLLASASPASAQTDDAGTAHESASTAPPDSTAPPPVDLQLSAPELPPLPTDLNALAPTLPSVTDVLPPPLQPAVSDAAALLPARVRAPLAPVLSHAAPAPVDVAPATSAQAGASPPPPPSAGTPTPPHEWP